MLTIIASMNAFPLNFIKEHAHEIMSRSPISYVKDAQLRGKLFDPKDTSDLISSADTNY